jgi:hypothetical protein
MAKKNRIYSVFHAMDDAGMFDNNPANQSAGPLYRKQQFPRMVWHPEGETRVTQEAEEIETKSGVKFVGEKREIIYRVANNRREYDRLLQDGWHAHPAGAMKAAGLEPPVVSAAEEIDSLKAQLDALKAKLRDAQEYDAATSVSRKVRHNAMPSEDEEDDGDDLPEDVEELLAQREDDDAPDIDPHAGGAITPTPAARRSTAAAKLTTKQE